MPIGSKKLVTKSEFSAAMLKIDKRFDEMDQRFDQRFDEMDQRFEKRFDEMDQRFDQRFDEMDQRFDQRFDEMDQRFEKRFDEMDQRFEKRFHKMDIRLDKGDISIHMLWTAIKELEEKMYTKADHEKCMVWMDKAMTELRDARDDRKLMGHQLLRLDDKVEDHEKRIRTLEG